MCSLCRLPVAKNHNFGQILTFSGLLYQPPFTDEGQIWCAIADRWYTLTCQILSGSVYSVVLWWRKPPIFVVFCRFLPFFGLWHLVMSPIGIDLRKLSTGAQLPTYPYPTASKSFLYSNAFMAKSGAQTLMFKSVTDKPTDRLKKLNVSMKSKPHQTWHGDRGPRARSCASKTFGV